ncbi:MAG TPA: tRNA (N6-isopentenyl adenosine(37)-C2)-methylthiotransferase MiaB [Alphaproteobacteria bacterium]|nr:tRNA (N6-isopentenyl adenosine(37)-C2)-methylthiotransferase MiaB [Alphaproteobacteria bacterium]
MHIKTWGCQMNVYDSQRMADVLAPLGYAESDEIEGADLVILNTCHIREKATEKVFSELGRMRKHRAEKEKAGGKMAFAVAGCVAQAEGAEILRRDKNVDMVFGPQTYHKLPEMIANWESANGKTRILNTEFPPEPKFDHFPAEQATRGTSAFVAVQEGCDKFCSFCVVPYTRGAEYSRPAADIISEIKHLIAKGVREVTLLGQNVNAWHGDGLDDTTWDLGRLIFQLAEINGLDRIRYMTSHPRDMHDMLYRAHGEVPQLMPYLHLPVQHGSDKILETMNRKHTADDYMRIIHRLRDIRPDMAFSSDFIVGFPGETDADHRATMKLVDEVGYAAAYSFKYSRRPGTPAAKAGKQVSEDIKDRRLQELQTKLYADQTAFNASKLGMTIPVLLDRKGRNDGQLQGHSPWLQTVNVAAPDRLMGQIMDVTITKTTQNSLTGEIVTIAPISEIHAA